MATSMPAISTIDVANACEHVARRAHALIPVPEAALLAGRALGDGPEDQAEADQADQPGEEGRALKTPGQPERPAERARRAVAPGSLGEQAAAEVASRGVPAGGERCSAAAKAPDRASSHQWSPPNGRSR